MGIKYYIIAGLLIALAFTGSLLKNAWDDIARLETEKAQITKANQANVAILEETIQEYDNLVRQREADLRRAEIIAVEVRQRNQALEQALENSRDEREVIYAENPDADQWGRTIVPAAIANSLRF